MPFVAQQLEQHAGPVIASTDYMKNYAEQIRAFMPKGRTYKVLGTDGFGRSDFRSKLREHFEVNRHYIVVAALKALADEGTRAGGQGGRGDQEVRHRRRARSTRCTPDRTTTRRQNMALVEVKVPDIGDFKDVEVIELLVKPGDTVKAEQSLITVESDKASMEIPSSHAGVVKELKVKLGDKVGEGSAAAGAGGRGRARRCRRAPRRRRRRRAAAPAPRRRRLPRRPPAAARSTCVVPDIGDFDEVAVIELLVKPGDTIKVEQSLITVETRQGLDGDPVVACRRA